MLLLTFYFIFFHENYFYFLCSGMFRNVPECSMFRVLSTPYCQLVLVSIVRAVSVVECAAELAPSISQLFNFSMDHGKLPSVWKSPNVVPIHKSGERTLAEN